MLFHSAAALFIRRRFGCFFFVVVVPCAFYCLCARFVSDSVAASTFVCHLLEGLFIYQDTHSDTRKLAIRPPSTRKASRLQCNRLIALHKSPVNQLPAVTARTLNPIFSFSFAYGHVVQGHHKAQVADFGLARSGFSSICVAVGCRSHFLLLC